MWPPDWVLASGLWVEGMYAVSKPDSQKRPVLRICSSPSTLHLSPPCSVPRQPPHEELCNEASDFWLGWVSGRCLQETGGEGGEGGQGICFPGSVPACGCFELAVFLYRSFRQTSVPHSSFSPPIPQTITFSCPFRSGVVTIPTVSCLRVMKILQMLSCPCSHLGTQSIY